MTRIELETIIAAPIGICFDAARDIGLHLAAAADTDERVIAGRRQGLCEAGDRITWQARHFSIVQQLSVEITDMEYPRFFCDRMTRGAFKSMYHEHYFEVVDGATCMKDRFVYETPFFLFGKIFDALILRRYMTNFLLGRNRYLTQYCENL